MPSNAQIVHNMGTLAPGFAPTSWDDLLQKIPLLLTSYLSGTYNTFNYGNATPAAEDQDKPWFRTNADGSFDRIYAYINGAWLAKHLYPAAGSYRGLWVGTVNDLKSFDGGDGTATATTTTGPMWEVDSNFAAKFLVAPGTFDDSGTLDVATSTTDTSVSGADKVTMAFAEMPQHFHGVGSGLSLSNDDGAFLRRDWLSLTNFDSYIIAGNTDNPSVTSINSGNMGSTNAQSDSTVATGAHNNLPPMYGVYVIKRTAREYYKV